MMWGHSPSQLLAPQGAGVFSANGLQGRPAPTPAMNGKYRDINAHAIHLDITAI
ncbi:hypothetical protein PPIS_a2590 [Pseudoalteromonas piscicida]|uniref:Uncharacterized protein n=1 Tax=Pseudoalteromonas piscicida TaxID=43662 RepID=A0ABM6NFF6_PSEO7|nr:hypothetical protein PPIS_a2590 [Pseudoalteromonas piscicida]